ncbi:MAG: type IV secretory system conjugative DNA transfer family protein [Beijerinckiaceae bacterium]
MHTHYPRSKPDYLLGALHTGEAVPLLQADRRRHMAVFGQTGTGKTAVLLNLMRADLVGGAGYCFLDPHGDAAQDIAAMTPAARMQDVIYLDPSDLNYTFAFNPLAGVPSPERATAGANIVSAFKNIWADSWGPRLEFILSNALRLLMDTNAQTLSGVPRLLADDSYRAFLIRQCRDPVIRYYWSQEFPAFDNRQRTEMISPIQNKIGILLANPFIRSILCHPSSTLNIQRVMNEGKVLIINLSKGNLGTGPAHLLGALLITAFSQAAEARRNMAEHDRRDFTLYCDEFANFATESFGTILSEARKWRLSLVAVAQHVSQLAPSLQHAVFGNVGTLIAFRVGALDAPILASELGIKNSRALQETDNYHAWIRLMRHGMPLHATQMETFPPPSPGNKLDKVIAQARNRHMLPRRAVDKRIEQAFRCVGVAPRKRARRHPDRE